MLARSRTMIGPQSPRSTAPYQTDAPASIVTSPIIVAVGAMNASSAIVGRWPSNSKLTTPSSLHRPFGRSQRRLLPQHEANLAGRVTQHGEGLAHRVLDRPAVHAGGDEWERDRARAELV